MDKKIYLFWCLILFACCNRGQNIDDIASRHADKLRKHFVGDSTEDVSTLISETRAISRRLKNAGMIDQANKFDSYTDVLMYGNNTIDESLHDVMELVKHRNCVCPTLQSIRTKLFGCF